MGKLSEELSAESERGMDCFVSARQAAAAARLLDEAEQLASAVVERSIATTDRMPLDEEQIEALARALLTKLRSSKEDSDG